MMTVMTGKELVTGAGASHIGEAAAYRTPETGTDIADAAVSE